MTTASNEQEEHEFRVVYNFNTKWTDGYSVEIVPSDSEKQSDLFQRVSSLAHQIFAENKGDSPGQFARLVLHIASSSATKLNLIKDELLQSDEENINRLVTLFCTCVFILHTLNQFKDDSSGIVMSEPTFAIFQANLPTLFNATILKEYSTDKEQS